MFTVKPLIDDELKKEICEALNILPIAGTMAYYAAELETDMETISEYIGICQFTPEENSVMHTLLPSQGREKDEAMIVMCRSVMNLLWRIGAKTMFLPHTAGPAELLIACGLVPCDGGFTVDLAEFYKSPCHFNKE